MTGLQIRVVLLLITQGAVLFAFFSAKTPADLRSAFLVSLVFGGLLTWLLAWTTTRKRLYFIRKLMATCALFWLFAYCFSLIRALRLSDLAFHESGEWAPINPEVVSAPLAFVAAGVGSLAMIAQGWLTSISEPPDPV